LAAGEELGLSRRPQLLPGGCLAAKGVHCSVNSEVEPMEPIQIALSTCDPDQAGDPPVLPSHLDGEHPFDGAPRFKLRDEAV